MADDDSALAKEHARLLSLASHELRTPLSVVGGYLRMLQRDTTDPLTDRQRKLVEDAERACLKMTAIVAELSDIGRLDDSQSALAREPFDLFDLVHAAAAECGDASERGVQLAVRGVGASAPMIGDRMRLGRALAAILSAALREQPDSTIVIADCRLTRHTTGLAARIVVTAEHQLERVATAAMVDFDDKRGGTGLALPIARRVIERHGGRLWSATGEGMAAMRGAVVVSLPLGA